MLYKFSPVYITPLTNGVLCAHLEKSMMLINYNTKNLVREHQSKIALYSIDCVRKLLLNHHFNNEFIFELLDEAREAEMKDDQDFWEVPQQVRRFFLDSEKIF
jgi:DNA-dependent RNA polymerase auxiliary subunit epsilon